METSQAHHEVGGEIRGDDPRWGLAPGSGHVREQQIGFHGLPGDSGPRPQPVEHRAPQGTVSAADLDNVYRVPGSEALLEQVQET